MAESYNLGMLDALQVALIFLVVVIGLLASFVVIISKSVRREIEKLASETDDPEEKIEIYQKLVKAIYPPRFNR